MSSLALLAPLIPLVLAALLVVGPLRPAALALAPWAPAPALALALGPDPGVLELDWVLLGVVLDRDGLGQALLVLMAAVWLAAAAYARGRLRDDERRVRFQGFFLLCMAGSLGAPLAQDLVSFYLLFALTTFSAYGLVIHAGGAAAVHAARVYVVFAVLGEGLLIAGLLLAAGAAGGALELGAVREAVAGAPAAPLICALLLAGFGVKAGAVPLHPWLALAHPVAPTPASAVLSGAVVAVGLLGWLRFLPLGLVALAPLGAACVALGLTATFGAALIGLLQRDLKTLLAYSTISQMGLMLTGVGVALAAPEAMPAMLGLLALFALAHGLAKGALFLATGIVDRPPTRRLARWALAIGVALPALAVAGAPLTGGAIVKAELAGAGGGLVGELVELSAVTTALLMGRFLLLARAAARAASGAGAAGPAAVPTIPWAALVAAAAATPWAAPALLAVVPVDPYATTLGGFAGSAWPLGVAAALLAAGPRLLARWPARARLRVPPGDVVVVYERAAVAAMTAAGAVAAAFGRRRDGLREGIASAGRRDFGGALVALDDRLADLATAALLLVTLSAIVFLLS